MGEKIIVGPINKGLRNDRTAFIIDNDSFPTLINAYQWRGRVKRKRGSSFLTRLQRFFNSTSVSYNSGSTTIPLAAVTGTGNLVTGFSLQSTANIVPGSVTITVGVNVYTDPAMDGNLSPSGSINYSTGAIIIVAEAGNNATATFMYYPGLPVMGIEEIHLTPNENPGTMAFDTKYSYIIINSSPYLSYDVSFYKNPDPSITLPGYIRKTNTTPTTWNGQDYQQFWTVNYEGALWATNGITIPFTKTNIGMQFKPIVTVTVTAAGPPATATLNIVGHGLVVGDFLFINEVATTTGINFQTGYVIAVLGVDDVSVEFPNATLVGNGAGGIAQYLTNRADTTLDCLRYYDGDPTDGSATAPLLNGTHGWVNFAPPLSQFDFSVAGLPKDQYYLVGARMILPFKDRLLFFGPVVQTSSLNSQIYLQDTIIFSQNGTPYYTCSFTGDVIAATTVFTPILVPDNQTATASAYFEDQTGFGGFISAGISQPIVTASSNEDVIIVGFGGTTQTKIVYSGDDLQPFNFYLVNTEYGSNSTFSIINMDQGVITRGDRGYIITGQTQAQRIDLEIPDEVFQIKLTDNGSERVTAQRDFINEWMYFTYPSNQNTSKFPNRTLQYNYRDDSYGIFHENYTTYGVFRFRTGFTWATIGQRYPTWSQWNDPWNAGTSTLLQPQVAGGNTQGFVMIRSDGTGEQKSLTIKNISFPTTITGATQANPAVLTVNNTYVAGQTVTIAGVVGMTQLNGNTYTITAATPTTITLNVDSSAFTAYISGGTATPPTIYSPNHNLTTGDYIVIENAIGTISSQVNGNIFSVKLVNVNEFDVLPPLTTGTYLGKGTIKKMYVPFIQTKQFPVSWGIARKTRIGPQQYLFTKTPNGQITLLIFLSQDSADAYNQDPIVPDSNAPNDSLIYSTVLYTCPESTNLGLTPANINLQMVTGLSQSQIWHRKNTSLLGDTVQIGFTMSDAQMRDPEFTNQFEEIELHSFILDVTPSQVLA